MTMLFSRQKITMVEPGPRPCAAATDGARRADLPRGLRHPGRRPCRPAPRSPTWRWAASGAPRSSSGRRPGVTNTAVGYTGGYTPNPTYEEVCSAKTGHTEIVKVGYDPAKVSYEQLLKIFFENHDPTQGMRQGNDVGTQYRSAIYTTTDEQAEIAKRRTRGVPDGLHRAGYGEITTEIDAGSRTSTTPRTTTSSTWTRTRSATVPCTPPESPATEAARERPVLPRGGSVAVIPTWLAATELAAVVRPAAGG